MTQIPPTPDDSESGVSSEEVSAPVPVISEWVIPPEEALTAPLKPVSAKENATDVILQLSESPWLVVAKNRRVNRDWEALLLRAPENTRRCYQDLCTSPMVRKPKRVFPLKGKLYEGAWECDSLISESR